MNLDNVDAVVLLDKSGSMDEKLRNKNMTRWQAGQESIAALAEELAKHDDDGITVVPFGPDYNVEDGVTPDRVQSVFSQYRPGGGTYLAPALRAVIDRFLPATKEVVDRPRQVPRKVLAANQPAPQPKTGLFGKLFGGSSTPEPVYETVYDTVVDKVETGKYVRQSPKKQVFLAIYTDGAASDEQAVISTIADATKRITSRRDLGILFIQVGEDPQATAFLERLNSGLEGGVADFDIVAVCKLDDLEDLSTEDTIKKAFTE
jgi:hypothetical protein